MIRNLCHVFRSAIIASTLVTASACGSESAGRPIVSPTPIADNDPFKPLATSIAAGDFGRTEAVIVEQAGEVLFEAHFRGNKSDTRVDVRSAGKSITAIAVGTAITDGQLPGVDVKVWDYLTAGQPVANDGALKREITVDDLLAMSSALECNDWVSSSPGNEEKMYRRDSWTKFALDIPIDPAYHEGARGRGRFSYCTAGVFLLGRVVEKATGQRFDAYVQSRLFDPLGIPGADWTTSPTGEIQSGGQLSIRARDLAQIARLVANGGVYNGQQVVETDWLRTMLTPKNGANPEMDYSYLWWTRFFQGSAGSQYGGAFMLGNGGNLVLFLPDLDAIIVIQATNYNKSDAFEDSVRMVEQTIIPVLESRMAS